MQDLKSVPRTFAQPRVQARVEQDAEQREQQRSSCEQHPRRAMRVTRDVAESRNQRPQPAPRNRFGTRFPHSSPC